MVVGVVFVSGHVPIVVAVFVVKEPVVVDCNVADFPSCGRTGGGCC